LQNQCIDGSLIEIKASPSSQPVSGQPHLIISWEQITLDLSIVPWTSRKANDKSLSDESGSSDEEFRPDVKREDFQDLV
jgi:hypothetical protein